MKKVLVISDDYIGTKMAGPGIRAWELSKVLAGDFNVTLLAPDLGGEIPQADFQVNLYSPNHQEFVREKEGESDFIIVQGFVLDKFSFLKDTKKVLIVDIYVPFVLENLFLYRLREKSLAHRIRIHRRDLQVLLSQLEYGDHFVCANERQRDFLMGMLTGLQRVDPVEIEDDPKLNNLIGIVPFGIPKFPPTHSQQVVKGVIDGINEDDFLLIWGGSISNWFDMETLIKAMKEVSKQEQRIKLFFMGTKHPNPLLPDMEIYHQTLNLTKELKLLGKTVFFGKDWVPYEERANYLLEADCGVSTHLAHIESRFSFRTRIVDYIWCGMPTILTEGDFFSEKIKENGGGIIVPEGNPDVLVGAILKMYRDRPFRERCSEAMKNMRKAFTWSEVAKPLIDYISNNFIGKKSRASYMAERLNETSRLGENYSKVIDPVWHAHLEEFHRAVNASLAYKTYKLFKKILGN